MAKEGSGPAEITSAEIVETRLKADYPGQRRNYSYVVRINATDPDTGEPSFVNEYRTIASDRPLSSETILNRITDLFEAGI